jgi:hypothetical protein
MKAWLKGGLIGGGIYVIIVLVYILLQSFAIAMLALVPSYIFFSDCLLSGFGGPTPSCNESLVFIIAIIINLFFYFLFGSLMGFFIEKIMRLKNQQSLNNPYTIK